MSKFQLILTGVFGAFILIGVLVFSFARGSATATVPIVIWGTMPSAAFNDVYFHANLDQNKIFTVQYVEKDPNTFDADFLNALASGTGPDVVLLPHEEILKQASKLFTIPYTTFAARDYQNLFVDEATLFETSQGIIAVPLTIDPLVMYWNKDTFNNASIATPPGYWDQMYTLAQNLTQKDGAFNITQSTLPLGEYNNVSNAKAIISTLLLQAGTPIVSSNGTTWQSALSSNPSGATVVPGISALSFYTEFSNAAKPYYTWNRSLPESQSMFLSGDLALYFGFASEYRSLQLKNPNLNFDVAAMPQARSSSKKITFGEMEGLAIVKNSKNIAAAYSAVVALVAQNVDSLFATELSVAPARRDLLATLPADSAQTLFWKSALQTQAWLDPDFFKTDALFRDLVNNITGGSERLEQALNDANSKLQSFLPHP